MIGQELSHYKILEKLGEGGMGVVYKAQDTKLNRTVALKFLPDRVNQDPMAKERFLQEARAAAGLNHPNICTIHGVEDEGGSLFIVMEHIDGGTLREKLPFSKTEDAIAVASQIGEALQEAHSKGIVHRDIKADNIMLTPKGQAKVMDFGLAKLKGALKLTKTSSTVGTLGYMAPEQIQGGEVDHRSDIFSFGVLLFEMLSGKLPFRGEHEAAMVYSIVNEEPQDIASLVPDVSPIITNLIQRCLEKDPTERYQHFDDITADLKRAQKKTSRVMRSSAYAPTSGTHNVQITSQSSISPSGIPPEVQRGSKRPKWIAGISVGALIVAVTSYYFLTTRSPVATAVRAEFAQVTQLSGVEWEPDFSPDGSFITYTKRFEASSSVYLQRVAGGDPIDLSKDARTFSRSPAYSPDGQTIAFRSSRDGGGIFLMGSTGESIKRLTNFGFDPAWSPDGKRMVVATQEVGNPAGRGLYSQLVILTLLTGEKDTVQKEDAVQPSWSPHGHRIAYWGLVAGGTGQRDIWTMPVNGGEAIPVTSDAFIDWNPVWSPDGEYLYFASDRGGSQNLWRVPIDEETGSVLGEPQPVTTPSRWSGYIAVSRDGRKIAFTSFDVRSNISKLIFDPQKKEFIGSPTPVTQGSREIESVDVSPDGDWLVFNTGVPQMDIYIIKADGSNQRQLTNDPEKDRSPKFSPDGERIAFQSERSGRWEAWSIRTDGSGLEQLTKASGSGILSPRWFPDGKRILVTRSLQTYVVDLMKPLDLRVPVKLPALDTGGTSLGDCQISPDGKWIAGYRRSPQNTALPGLTLYSLEKESSRILTDSAANHLWLADSRNILYTKDSGFCIVNILTGKSQSVPSPIVASDFSGGVIAPDNRSVYYVRYEVEADIWLATLQE